MEEKDLALKNTINLIIAQIHNGVINEKTGEKRNFDMFDYYTYTSMSLKEFMQASKKLGINPTGIRTFFKSNISMFSAVTTALLPKVEVETIMGMNYSVNGIAVTTEQKELIINYLKNNNIPVNVQLFRLAFKRYINNMIDIEPDKTKTL